MIRSSILSSGSKGNAIYFETDKCSILIDNGLSFKRLEEKLEFIDRRSDDLTAVIVSHEHGDHAKGVALLAKRKNIPVYITPSTLAKLPDIEARAPHLNIFHCGNSIEIEDVSIDTFPTPHDAIDSSGFILRSGDYSIGLATDMGYVTNLAKYKLSTVNHLMIEANHDPELLMIGPYPWHVKQRIKGTKGHLSNNDCFELLRDVLHEEMSHVSFLHLSDENNNKDILHQMAAEKLVPRNLGYTIGSQLQASPLI